MDARSFQQHAARVAELTDTLLAERTANKALSALGAKPDSADLHPDSDSAAAVSGSATPATASPNGTAATTPDQSNGPAAPAVTTQVLFTPERAGIAHSGEVPPESREGNQSCLPASTRDGAVPAASSTSTSAAGGKATGFPPSSEAPLLPAGVARGPYYCTVCSVSATSAAHLQTHYMGSKHQRRLAQSQDSREHSPHYCSVCGISATSAVHLQLHLNGRAHQRKAKLASQAGAGGSGHAPAALADTPQTGGMAVLSAGNRGRSSHPETLYCLLAPRGAHCTLTGTGGGSAASINAKQHS